MTTLGLTEHLLRAAVVPPFVYIRRFLRDKAFREYEIAAGRYRNCPRFKEIHVSLGGYDILAPDAASLLSSWKEIFVEEIYACASLPERPRILDLGANIGVSILGFKRRYPGCHVLAYEADPAIFAYLKRNVERNNIKDVDLVNQAVWHCDATLHFWAEGADGGRVESGAISGPARTVQGVDIAAALAGEKFDFIKMDIEGAEASVLPRCASLLKTARAVFVEYHSRAGSPQALVPIHQILTDAGFRVYLTPVYCNPKPFSRVDAVNGFDMQLNLFAVR